MVLIFIKSVTFENFFILLISNYSILIWNHLSCSIEYIQSIKIQMFDGVQSTINSSEIYIRYEKKIDLSCKVKLKKT